MEKMKVGDIVARKSYNKDILFRIKRIIETKKGKIAILIGVIERVEADSNLADLEKVNIERVDKDLKYIQKKIDKKINNLENINRKRNEFIMTGKILHLDGDSCLDNKNTLLVRFDKNY